MGIGVALTVGALGAGAARAAVPTAPPNGSATADRSPTLSWALEAGERSFVIELSPNPATAPEGGFVRNDRLRFYFVDGAATSAELPGSEPLDLGTWYWHVGTLVPGSDQVRFSPTATFAVIAGPPPPRGPDIRSARFTYNRCKFLFHYRARLRPGSAPLRSYRLSLFRVGPRGGLGRRLATEAGRLGVTSFRRTFPNGPRTVGRRFALRLTIRDQTGKRDRATRTLRTRRCPS